MSEDRAGLDVLPFVARRLNDTSSARWHVKGDRVRGPGKAAVVLGSGHEHAVSDGHVDLAFVLDTDRPDSTTLCDCVSGTGATREERLESAVRAWGTTTAAAVLELLEGRGWHGERFAPDDPKGFTGWHSIQGGVVGAGTGPERQAVMMWAGRQALLRLIAPTVTEEQLNGPGPIGIKFFWGSSHGKDVAEVRINSQDHAPAAAALLAADWPRPESGASYARTYFVLDRRA
ncbi:DUF6348 family protein [Streptacidiphilus rugosus]|uniref:DUF6348 family protein n=1 Tax=Streptacidiphilus rugosus TaxID=405783 RepID=UPI00056B9517|nr:DUF6348 family protein [Streptacidiphilus rugosus]